MKKELTPAQKGVNELLLLGFSNKEIGEKLCIGIKTVKTHVHNIYRAHGSKSRSHHIANHYIERLGKLHEIQS